MEGIRILQLTKTRNITLQKQYIKQEQEENKKFIYMVYHQSILNWRIIDLKGSFNFCPLLRYHPICFVYALQDTLNYCRWYTVGVETQFSPPHLKNKQLLLIFLLALSSQSLSRHFTTYLFNVLNIQWTRRQHKNHKIIFCTGKKEVEANIMHERFSTKYVRTMHSDRRRILTGSINKNKFQAIAI